VRPAAPLRRFLPLVLTLALLGAANAALLRTVGIRADMTEFLPPPRNEASAFLLRELRTGAATTLLLAGIEGAPAPELARLSRAVGDQLRASGRFAFVGNGTEDLSDTERDLLFRYRYLLSPAVTPSLFETQTLRAKLEALLDGLRGSASPLLARFGFADPVGAFPALLRTWLADSAVMLREGVWFADTPPGAGERALLVARTAATGLDTEAQRAAVALFRDAFAAANPAPGARLLLSGPGVFAAEAAAAIRADLAMISVFSSALIAGFLLWRFRSLLMLLVVAVPLSAGVLVGAAVVTAVFGGIHGAALGFSMTMLGVTDDYPILLIAQRRPDETLAQTGRRIWPTLRLASLAAAAGLTAMILSGVIGLAQLGLFAAVGLPTSALVTRHLLPRLVPAGAPIAARPLPAPLLRALLALPHRRGLAWALLAAAALYLLAIGGPPREEDVAALSPVPQAQRNLDGELRRQLGAPDVRFLIAVAAPTIEAALQGAERIGEALAPLVEAGALGGYDLPTRYLPSARTQRARQGALPDAETLRARLREAAAGLPFRPAAFDRFLADIEASRTLPPLTRADLAAAGPLLAARLDPLLSPLPEGGGGWQALVVPTGLRDTDALRASLAELSLPGLLMVEVKPETQSLVDAATARALLWCGVGAALVLALLALSLRGLRPALQTATPLAGAVLLTLAALSLIGEKFNLFHLVSLLLLAGVGMDYALFIARSADEPLEERARALGSVVNCTFTTLLTFGLLAFCTTPVLRSIGLTVAIGIACAATLAATLVAAPRRAPT
jgi:predicted exporter